MVDVLVFAYDRQSLNLAEAESWVFFLGGGGNDKLEGQTLRLGSLKLNFLSN